MPHCSSASFRPISTIGVEFYRSISKLYFSYPIVYWTQNERFNKDFDSIQSKLPARLDFMPSANHISGDIYFLYTPIHYRFLFMITKSLNGLGHSTTSSSAITLRAACIKTLFSHATWQEASATEICAAKVSVIFSVVSVQSRLHSLRTRGTIGISSILANGSRSSFPISNSSCPIPLVLFYSPNT